MKTNNYLETKILGQDVWVYILKRYIKDLGGKSILDLGCGFGGLGIACVKEGTKFTGVDISDDIYKARQLSSGKLELLKSDGCYLPFKSDIFDAVISIGTIEHVNKPTSFVGEMLRVLKPKGYIFLFYGPNRRFHWLDNPAHKKLVCSYLTFSDIHNVIKPFVGNVDLVWSDIMKYRIYNRHDSPYIKNRYQGRIQFILDIIYKQDFMIKPIYSFCRLLEKFSYQPNIALVAQKL